MNENGTVEKGKLTFIEGPSDLSAAELGKFKSLNILTALSHENIKELIERCRKQRPDGLLFLQGNKLGVNDLRLLADAAKELQMGVMVTRQKWQPGQELPLKGVKSSLPEK